MIGVCTFVEKLSVCVCVCLIGNESKSKVQMGKAEVECTGKV